MSFVLDPFETLIVSHWFPKLRPPDTRSAWEELSFQFPGTLIYFAKAHSAGGQYNLLACNMSRHKITSESDVRKWEQYLRKRSLWCCFGHRMSKQVWLAAVAVVDKFETVCWRQLFGNSGQQWLLVKKNLLAVWISWLLWQSPMVMSKKMPCPLAIGGWLARPFFLARRICNPCSGFFALNCLSLWKQQWETKQQPQCSETQEMMADSQTLSFTPDLAQQASGWHCNWVNLLCQE